ncbi:hypothetical protein AAZV13_15G195300 [Glycine max]
MWSIFLRKIYCHKLLFLWKSVIVQMLKDWTRRVFATYLLSRICFLMTAPASNAYQRRFCPNPFHLWKFGAVHCSHSAARNHINQMCNLFFAKQMKVLLLKGKFGTRCDKFGHHKYMETWAKMYNYFPPPT